MRKLLAQAYDSDRFEDHLQRSTIHMLLGEEDVARQWVEKAQAVRLEARTQRGAGSLSPALRAAGEVHDDLVQRLGNHLRTSEWPDADG